MTLSAILRKTAALLFVSAAMHAASASAAQPSDFDPLSAPIEDNIKYPSVPASKSTAIAEEMSHLERAFRNAGYATAKVRSGEVTVVTIPCSTLFMPNSTELKADGASRLKPLLPYIKRADKYKVIIAVHSDDTGEDEYTDALTADRATAIDDWFYNSNDSHDTGIIPYGLGADEPLVSNHGIANRAKNRRVEIYFVPTKHLIDKTPKKK